LITAQGSLDQKVAAQTAPIPVKDVAIIVHKKDFFSHRIPLYSFLIEFLTWFLPKICTLGNGPGTA
jgi:hypothetical protein